MCANGLKFQTETLPASGLTFAPRSNLIVSRQMSNGQGYEILHNGVPRTFRDRRETAFEAAQFAKSRAKGDIIELRDCATGEKLVMLVDGRVG